MALPSTYNPERYADTAEDEAPQREGCSEDLLAEDDNGEDSSEAALKSARIRLAVIKAKEEVETQPRNHRRLEAIDYLDSHLRNVIQLLHLDGLEPPGGDSAGSASDLDDDFEDRDRRRQLGPIRVTIRPKQTVPAGSTTRSVLIERANGHFRGIAHLLKQISQALVILMTGSSNSNKACWTPSPGGQRRWKDFNSRLQRMAFEAKQRVNEVRAHLIRTAIRRGSAAGGDSRRDGSEAANAPLKALLGALKSVQAPLNAYLHFLPLTSSCAINGGSSSDLGRPRMFPPALENVLDTSAALTRLISEPKENDDWPTFLIGLDTGVVLQVHDLIGRLLEIVGAHYCDPSTTGRGLGLEGLGPDSTGLVKNKKNIKLIDNLARERFGAPKKSNLTRSPAAPGTVRHWQDQPYVKQGPGRVPKAPLARPSNKEIIIPKSNLLLDERVRIARTKRFGSACPPDQDGPMFDRGDQGEMRTWDRKGSTSNGTPPPLPTVPQDIVSEEPLSPMGEASSVRDEPRSGEPAGLVNSPRSWELAGDGGSSWTQNDRLGKTPTSYLEIASEDLLPLLEGRASGADAFVPAGISLAGFDVVEVVDELTASILDGAIDSVCQEMLASDLIGNLILQELG